MVSENRNILFILSSDKYFKSDKFYKKDILQRVYKKH